MSYGLQVFSASGATRLEISDSLTRVRYSFTIAQNTHGTLYIPGEAIDWSKATIVTIGYVAVGGNADIGNAHYVWPIDSNNVGYGFWVPENQWVGIDTVGPTHAVIMYYK